MPATSRSSSRSALQPTKALTQSVPAFPRFSSVRNVKSISQPSFLSSNFCLHMGRLSKVLFWGMPLDISECFKLYWGVSLQKSKESPLWCHRWRWQLWPPGSTCFLWGRTSLGPLCPFPEGIYCHMWIDLMEYEIALAKTRQQDWSKFNQNFISKT